MSIDLFKITKPLLHAMDAEDAHHLALRGLSLGLVPAPRVMHHPALSQSVFGLNFKNPVGLAAGFDKNAIAINALFAQGFGFVEAGTVTPLAQKGNARPRIFRLPEDAAVINRLGFNNAGLETFVKNFSGRKKHLGIAGANIGKNKDQTDAVLDYVNGLHVVYPHADYITINISSPNTQGLRDLQAKAQLEELLGALIAARVEAEKLYNRYVPLLLKIAPDLDMQTREDIAQVVLEKKLDGVIISNTTVSRPAHVFNPNRRETGGLSGAPLFALSTRMLADIYKLTGGKIPLVGVGGISSPFDAYSKIRAGASLVQVYSALIYQGFGLVREINAKLPELLAQDGFTNIAEAIGADARL